MHKATSLLMPYEIQILLSGDMQKIDTFFLYIREKVPFIGITFKIDTHRIPKVC